MSSKNIVEVVIKATDDASKKLTTLNTVMAKVGGVATIAAAAIAAAGVIIVKSIINMTKDAAKVEVVRNTFDNLADSIGEVSDVMMKDLRVASRGMLNDADLMQASNKLVAMGLAKTAEESSKLVEISTQLGMAMGMTATDAAEAFALMLANQSIPRLDNFGISSGKVRDRILELMEATEGMTREEVFMIATMEQAEITMEKVGEQSEGAAGAMARYEASIANTKTEIGNAFLPMMASLYTTLGELVDNYGPAIVATITKWAETLTGVTIPAWIAFISKIVNEVIPAFEALGAGSTASMAELETAVRNGEISLGWLGDFILKVAILTAAIGAGFTSSMAEAKIALGGALLKINLWWRTVTTIFLNLKADIIKAFETAFTNVIVKFWEFRNEAAGVVNSIRALFMSISGMILKGPTYIGGGGGGSTSSASTPLSRGQLGHAKGGPVASGGTYLVGEEGPELFSPSSSGNIIPNDKLGGGRAINITLNLSSFLSLSDMENAERVLVPIVRNALRQAV